MLVSSVNPEGIPPAGFEWLRATLLKDRAEWFAASAPAFFGDGPAGAVSPELLAWGVNLASETSLLALIECQRAQVSLDRREEMRAVDIPTLIIHGAADTTAPLAVSGAVVAELIPGSRLEVYEDAAHGLPITHQERLAAGLLAFVGG